jgi:copper transport protein
VTSTVEMVGRFSTAAAVSVAALIGAGLALTGVELGSLRGLWDTTYGRLVLVKAAITAGVVVLAALNRFRLLPAIEAGAFDAVEPDAAAEAGDEAAEQAARWSRLRRLVAVEALALVAVLGVTAVLVNTTPSRTALGVSGGAVSLTQDIPNGTVNLEVAPAKSGPNTMHIQYRDSAGAPIDLATTLTVELSLPSEDLGPIQRQIVKLAPGHFVLEGNEMSVPGEWTVTLAARTSDFTEQRNTFQVLVTR